MEGWGRDSKEMGEEKEEETKQVNMADMKGRKRGTDEESSGGREREGEERRGGERRKTLAG